MNSPSVSRPLIGVASKCGGILKLLQKCSKQESKHLVISISDCIFEQDAGSVTVFVNNMQAMSMKLNVSEEEKGFSLSLNLTCVLSS